METTWIWIVFNAFIVGLLVLDLGIFHRNPHAMPLKEALGWSLGWIGLALLFNLAIYFQWERFFPDATEGRKDAALLFLTGYLIELSLSVDNLFVMALIFSSFGVPLQYQHRVLFWGILGALIMRGIMIAGGVVLLSRFHWILFLFGGFLVFMGLRMLFHRERPFQPEKSRIIGLLKRIMPVTEGYEQDRFFVRRGGIAMATPLFAVLLIIEATDLMFAVDSIPAIFGITLDPFLVYTSNVFAVLGLRALYFVLAGFMEFFLYLKPALSAILVFVGAKMLLADIWRIPPLVSLAVVAGILAIAMAMSVAAERSWRRGGGPGLRTWAKGRPAGRGRRKAPGPRRLPAA